MSKIPQAITEAIEEQALEEWPSDMEMRREAIAGEKAAYLALQKLDYGPALPHKEFLLREAEQFSESWDERVCFVADEVGAFTEMLALDMSDVQPEALAEIMKAAEAESDWFSGQLDDVKKRLRVHRQMRDVSAKLEPMRELLTRMEKIVGNSCYNANIQNYLGGGILDSTGRKFRYPVSFKLPDGTKEKRWDKQDGIASEILITGHYKVGANELNIYRALIEIVDMLEADYGLKMPKT